MSHPPVLAAATEPFATGDTLENPCTGELGVLVKTPWDGDDRAVEADLHAQPGAAVVGEHVHRGFDERFTVREGRIGFRLDGEESSPAPGTSSRSLAAVGMTGGTTARRSPSPGSGSPRECGSCR
jgi:hypothetical protein